MRIWQVSLLGLALSIGVLRAEEPVPVGEEFQVNSYTTGFQVSPAVAVGPQGSFMVAWSSDGSHSTDADGNSVQAQRYNADGAPLGGEFQVNTHTTGDQSSADVASDARGNFVVVWHSSGSDGTDTSSVSIQARRYDADGTPAGGEFQVNSYTTSWQSGPSVAVDPRGSFVVVWSSDGSDGTDTDGNSVQAQRFDVNGAPVEGEFQVNSYTTGWQSGPAVAVDPQGSFVVVWHSPGSHGTDTSSYSIHGQRYNADGAPVGGEFQVNSYTTGSQSAADVAGDAQGNFVVVWHSPGSDGTDTSSYSIQGRRYDADGAPVGGEFQVNSYTTGFQVFPAVAVDPQGNFVVVWYSNGSDGTDTDGNSVQAQRYDADGAPVGGEFQVNSYTTDRQADPALAVDPKGSLVVVWSSDGSYGTDTSSYSIQGQRYALPIFSDGFESGDTSAWSSTAP